MEIKNTDFSIKDQHFIPKSLALAYVIPQIGDDTYEPMQGLKNGTIYPELYMPYVQRRYRNGQK